MDGDRNRPLVALAAFCAAFVLLAAIAAASASAAAWVGAGSFPGAGPGNIATSGIAVNQGSNTVYTTSAFPTTGPISAFNLDGTPASPASFGTGLFDGVAVDPATGNVYGLDESSLFGSPPSLIRTYTPAGAAVGSPIPVTGYIGSFVQIASGPTGNVYYPNGVVDVVQRFQPNGTEIVPALNGAGPNALNNPHSVAVDNAGNAYVADSPKPVNEEQTVTKNATGGTFKLGFEGQKTGATGTGNLSAATGTGDLSGASGTGNVASGSKEITGVKTTTGAFAVGYTITASGIPAGTTITAIGAETLTISANATSTGANRTLNAGLTTVSNVVTSTGAFAVGQRIAGTGIQSSTTIAAVGSGTLTLSKVANSTGTGVALSAGSTTVSGLNTSTGTFVVGETISGAGIPAGTTIATVDSGSLSLSAPATAAGTAVPLTADLGFNANSTSVNGALAALSTVGADNTSTSGSEGGPWTIEFSGKFAATNVPPLTTDASGLSGGEAKVTVETTTPGSFVPGHVYKFDPTGAFASVFMTGSTDPTVAQPSGLGVDPVNGTVFVVEGKSLATHVRAFSPGGSVLDDFGLGDFAETALITRSQVAVDSGTGRVYVTDPAAAEVQIYDPLPAPTVSTGAATGIAKSAAKLNATVNAEGTEADCEFVYDDDPGFGSSQTAPCVPSPVIGSTDTPVFANLSGLSPNTTYHFYVSAENEGGLSEGDVLELKTLPEVPVTVTGSAEGISQTSATLKATVNAKGDDATCQFEYGTSTAYGSKAPCSVSPVTGEAITAVSAALAGLSASTTYHYRVVATNKGGEGKGSDATFTTSAHTCETNPSLCPPSGSGTTPPVTSPPPAPKPLKCKKGFKKKVVKGKKKCVKIKKRKPKRRSRR